MSESDGKRPQSFIEDELIDIKPSTELIPDEYERENNGNVLVELVCRQTDDNVKDLENELTRLGYSVNKTSIDNKKINNIDEDWISTFVDSVNDKTSQRSYDGLLMIFAKIPVRNDILTTIWGNFTTANCPSLKDKPKIFLFQIAKRGLPTDSMRITMETAYDTPSEADILIVYDKISSNASNDFLTNLNDQIKDYGHQEDIINLVSISIGSETRPLVISTMTRKFFFAVHQYRGHHHNINERHAEIKENLERIITFVKNMPDNQPKDKQQKSMSFRNRVKKFSLSFRNKSQQAGKESDNDGKKAQGSIKEQQKLNEVEDKYPVFEPRKLSDANEEEAIAGPSKEKHKPLKPLKPPVEPIAVPPNKTPTRKSSIPITPTRRNSSTRTRHSSNSFTSKEDLSKKKEVKAPWKI